MIKVTKEGFCIELKSHNPASDLVELQRDIVSVLQSTDADMRGDENYFHLFELLKNTLPNEAQADQLFFTDIDE